MEGADIPEAVWSIAFALAWKALLDGSLPVGAIVDAEERGNALAICLLKRLEVEP